MSSTNPLPSFNARRRPFRSLRTPIQVAFVALLVAIGGIEGRAQQQPTVLRAMQAELQRSMADLSKLDVPPYFLSYSITEDRSLTLTATFGVLETDNATHRRILDVDLRVGNHEMDNTRSIRGLAFEMGQGTRGVRLPLGDDETALRAMIWRATDRAYKSAAERLGKVITNRKVKVAEEDSSADMSREAAHRHIDELRELPVDTATWRQRIVNVSKVFDAVPHLYEGTVSFTVNNLVKYVVNSEGSVIRTVEPIIKMMISCKTKSDDGMSLPLYRSYSAYKQENLPSEAELRADAQKLVDLVTRLRTAPLTDTYTGPAILTGRASGVFFHEIFGHRVEGHRQKDANSSQTFKAFLNKRILPDFIDVVFDPSIQQREGKDIAGWYRYDDEGIPGQRVVAVERGIFKQFLMSRSPIEHHPTSNGHGRRQAGNRCVSRQSNLLVHAHVTVPADSLRTMLRAECRKQGKDYGLLFDDIEGGFTFTQRTLPNSFNVSPLVVYKIYTDGRPDELVRGVDLIGTPLVMFGNIVAAGDDVDIFNGTCGAESGWVPVSASSPSLLVSTVEVQKKQKSQAKLPILDDPSAQTGAQP